MKKYFTILHEGVLKKVLIEEDKPTEVLAIKTLQQLQSKLPNFKHYINRVVYKLIIHDWDKFADHRAYNWKVIESQFRDQSSLGDVLYFTFETKGQAINRMIEDGFTIFIDGVEFKNA